MTDSKQQKVVKVEKGVQGKSELFMSLFESDRNRLYAYIFSITMDRIIADDVFQETSMVLWREFNTFQPGTSFSKWANGIAYNRIREQWRLNKKVSIGLSEEVVESLVEIENQDDEDDDEKWNYLQHCQSILPEHMKELYQNFYVKNLKAQEVADISGRSIFAIRKAVHKLRKKLFDCVELKMQRSTS